MEPLAGPNGNGSHNNNTSKNSHSTSIYKSSVQSLFTHTVAPPSTQILTDLAPSILQPRFLSSPHFSGSTSTTSSTSGSSAAIGGSSSSSRSLRERLGWHGSNIRPQRGDSRAIYIRERVEELCSMDVPLAPFDLSSSYDPSLASLNGPNTATTTRGSRTAFVNPDALVPLIKGFQATTPAAHVARLERRKKRAGIGEVALGLHEGNRLHLKERGEAARGLLASSASSPTASDDSVEGSLGINRRTADANGERRKVNGRQGKGKASLDGVAGEGGVELTVEELVLQEREVDVDMSHVAIRRAVLNSQVVDVTTKIAALESIREGLRRSLLGLREEELELEDEREGIRESISLQVEKIQGSRMVASSSRRRKGPAFLPGEHDDLPAGVAFMSLNGHLAPITALDFSSPYGILVSASQDESVRLWDLKNGDEIGFLRGHNGFVKALQVESNICVTGGNDGQIKIWDLDLAEAPVLPTPLASPTYIPASNETLVNGRENEGMMRESPGIGEKNEGPCVKTILGHTKAVTALYFDGESLITGSSDRTIKQFDLNTGQCVLTLDVIWAISNPLASQTLSSDTSSDEIFTHTSSPYSTPTKSPRKSLGTLRRSNSNFLPGKANQGFAASPTTTSYADGSWELFDDFVGGVQFWGYALASGTGDGCVRMWDLRTGSAHRTLIGHVGPVTAVQFDEYHLVSASLDKSIRIWDLRTGAISDTLRYDHPVTALQFDSRKILAAAGENGVKLFNRTTLQHSTLSTNGHSSPVERLRFMDKYLVSGGRDSTLKVWAL